jgi:hypothetical protein
MNEEIKPCQFRDDGRCAVHGGIPETCEYHRTPDASREEARKHLETAWHSRDMLSEEMTALRREYVGAIDRAEKAEAALAEMKASREAEQSDADIYALSASLLGKHGFYKAAEFLYAWANNGAHYSPPSLGREPEPAPAQKPELCRALDCNNGCDHAGNHPCDCGRCPQPKPEPCHVCITDEDRAIHHPQQPKPEGGAR